MKNSRMFQQIKELKEARLNRHQVHKRLGISYATVSKYWDMSQSEYDYLASKNRERKSKCKADKYREELVKSLSDFPESTAAQLYDQLEERHGPEIDFSERTMRNYVRRLREEMGLKP